MFSVEYFGGIVLITAFKIKRINFFTGEKLRKLILQSMKQDCAKIVLNIEDVNTIDAGVIENLKLLRSTTNNLGIELFLVNTNPELKQQIAITDYKNELHICSFDELEELAGIKV